MLHAVFTLSYGTGTANMPATFHDPSSTGVSSFRQQKLEREAKKNWDLFYKRNGDRFYKDRHWTVREFEELLQQGKDGEDRILLEVGCGAGNFVFPLIQDQVPLFVYGCDFSDVAVNLCQANPSCDASRCCFFVADLTSPDLRDQFLAAASQRHHDSVHLISIVFVLSAIHPDKHVTVVRNLKSVIAPGGTVLFRDYAVDDMAMQRFAPDNKIADRFFVRQDGTRAFYFDCESLSQMFTAEGFEEIESTYVNRSTINLKKGINSERTFVQAKFRLPTTS